MRVKWNRQNHKISHGLSSVHVKPCPHSWNKKVLLRERKRHTSGGSRISQRRGRQPPRWGHQLIIRLKNSRKLHENERIWTQRGGASLAPPLDPKMHTNCCVSSTTRWGTPPLGYPPARSDRGVPEMGYPPLGYPLARSDGGYPRWGTSPLGYLPARSDRGVPKEGYPPPGPGCGTPPGWTWPGYPPPGPGWGTPHLDLAGIPPSWTWPGYPPRCGQTDGWTDMCQNITFPHTMYAVSNKLL